MSTQRLSALPPIGPGDNERFQREQEERAAALSVDELGEIDRELAAAFPGGFTHRDEANALIALAVRNGPIEDLHAGKYSEWLMDNSLSRITDEEMKTLMLFGTRKLAMLLALRDDKPDVYRRLVQGYGSIYCSLWERNP